MEGTRFKAVFFDFMGTCLDWHASVVGAFPAEIPSSDKSDLALKWRQEYFDSNQRRIAAGETTEDIDVTLKRTLDGLLEQHTRYREVFTNDVKLRCVSAWHSMEAWPDVRDAIQQLKDDGYEVFVFGNGTTRLQLDLCKSSGLSFDMLFSSELLRVYKPAREAYEKTLGLVRAKPEQTVMVAAHAYDTRGAKAIGMRTIYVHRWTDDINEDMEVIKTEDDAFLEDMQGLHQAVKNLEKSKWL